MRKAATRSENTTKDVLSVRIDPALKRRMSAASEARPYRVSITNIVERGIELALKEIEELRKSK